MRGFAVTGTASNRGKGVNGWSSILKRRFTVLVLRVPSGLENGLSTVIWHAEQGGRSLNLSALPSALDRTQRVPTVF